MTPPNPEKDDMKKTKPPEPPTPGPSDSPPSAPPVEPPTPPVEPTNEEVELPKPDGKVLLGSVEFLDGRNPLTIRMKGLSTEERTANFQGLLNNWRSEGGLWYPGEGQFNSYYPYHAMRRITFREVPEL